MAARHRRGGPAWLSEVRGSGMMEGVGDVNDVESAELPIC